MTECCRELKNHLGKSLEPIGIGTVKLPRTNMDTLGDLLIRIKNGALAHKAFVSAPNSGLKEAVAAVLQKEGYIKSFSKKGKKVQKTLEVELNYDGDECRVHDITRLSKPSKRQYMKVDEITSVRQGFGHLVLSTPKGIMTDREARKSRVGGEALFKIW